MYNFIPAESLHPCSSLPRSRLNSQQPAVDISEGLQEQERAYKKVKLKLYDIFK